MPGTLARYWSHFVTDRGDVHRLFPKEELDRIQHVIADGEARHTGQVCFAIEAALPLPRLWHKVRSRQRALEVFGLLRVWDTEANDGVLLYVLLADRSVEIVADRGIDARVGDAAWQAICRKIEAAFRDGRFTEGVEQGATDISALLAEHSPRTAPGRNELPDAPVVL
jgi:uncharacterized membrane protein